MGAMILITVSTPQILTSIQTPAAGGGVMRAVMPPCVLVSNILVAVAQGMEDAYLKNPYHNSTHAADVVQGVAALFANNPFTAQLTDLEMLSMILACVMHDVGHPGAVLSPLLWSNRWAILTRNTSLHRDHKKNCTHINIYCRSDQ